MPDASDKSDPLQLPGEVLLPIRGCISGPVQAEVELTQHAVVTLQVFGGKLDVDVPVRLRVEVRAPHVVHHNVSLDAALCPRRRRRDYESQSFQGWSRRIQLVVLASVELLTDKSTAHVRLLGVAFVDIDPPHSNYLPALHSLHRPWDPGVHLHLSKSVRPREPV